jgi:hypothetical protein
MVRHSYLRLSRCTSISDAVATLMVAALGSAACPIASTTAEAGRSQFCVDGGSGAGLVGETTTFDVRSAVSQSIRGSAQR